MNPHRHTPSLATKQLSLLDETLTRLAPHMDAVNVPFGIATIESVKAFVEGHAGFIRGSAGTRYFAGAYLARLVKFADQMTGEQSVIIAELTAQRKAA